MVTQAEKGRIFRKLHEREGAFIIPNPWDVGSARILAHLGFEALATTSAGSAFSLGRLDGTLGRDEVLAHVEGIAAATDLPVSADLEKCFGDAPEVVADTIRRAAATGIVGGSVEDATERHEDPIYAFDLAVERVRAAAKAAHALPFPFTLTARAENFLHGRLDLKDTIERLRAFQDAGADVLYAPGLTARADIAAVVRSVDQPVNVLAMRNLALSLQELSAMGVKRISVGGGLHRAALGALFRAAREMRERGTFTWTRDAVDSKDLVPIFKA